MTTPGTLQRWLDSDVWHSFRSSPTAMVATAIAFVCLFCALFANVIAPYAAAAGGGGHDDRGAARFGDHAREGRQGPVAGAKA